jgi:hypothetical protein
MSERWPVAVIDLLPALPPLKGVVAWQADTGAAMAGEWQANGSRGGQRRCLLFGDPRLK